ncbi:MAG: serpin family protein [Deltaproteobacteria bacterium]|nr:serpin family protein [Deltaproteobacteria bacterium]
MTRLIVLSFVFAGISTPAGARGARPGSAVVVKGNSHFALDLYASLAADKKHKEKNLFFSPFSISTALAMTAAGARGQTAEQMAKVLHLEVADAKLHAAFGATLKALRAASRSRGNALAIANGLWGQKGYPFLKTFRALVSRHYSAGLRGVDFKKAPESARRTINAWVEGKTRHKIKNLIPPHVLNALTRLVLTNAIYFKGAWTTKFAQKKTRPRPFHLSSGNSVRVPLMQVKARFGFAKDEFFQVLELPYKGKKLSMVVILPRRGVGLPFLEKKLSASWLRKKLQRVRRQKVKVFFPKFKMTSALRLGDKLKALGMPLAFSNQADFSGMTRRPELKISKVIHQAFLDVNEEGTVAAAATAVVMKLRGGRPPAEPTFRADHPFVFLIRDRASGSILFLGRVMDPRK